MRHLVRGATLLGALLRVTGVTVAALAMLAAQPQGILAHSVITASDAGSAAMVGSGPGSNETPAQLPGSADRPVLTRTGGSGGTKAGTKQASNTGTRSASKKTTAGTNHQTGTNTGAAKPAAQAKSNTGTRSQSKAASKAATTAGTNHQTGTNTVGEAKAATTAGTNHQTGTNTVEAAANVVTPANVAANNASAANNNANAENMANEANTAGAANNANAANGAAVAGFQQPPMNAVTPTQTGANVAGQQSAAQPPMAGVLGLQGLPSTSTVGAALPAGTIALLSMGGALYAIRRKMRK